MFSVSWRWVLLWEGRTSILFLHMENQYWTIAHINCHCGIGGRRTSTSNQSPGKLFDLLAGSSGDGERSVRVRVIEIGRFSHFQLWCILSKVKRRLHGVCSFFLNQGAALCQRDKCMLRLCDSVFSLWGTLTTLTTGVALNKLHMFPVSLLSVGWWQTHSAASCFAPPELTQGSECFILSVSASGGQKKLFQKLNMFTSIAFNIEIHKFSFLVFWGSSPLVL